METTYRKTFYDRARQQHDTLMRLHMSQLKAVRAKDGIDFALIALDIAKREFNISDFDYGVLKQYVINDKYHVAEEST